MLKDRLLSFTIILGLSLILLSFTSEQTISVTLNELELTELEKMLVNLAYDHVFLIELNDSGQDVRSLEIGVDYYHFGKFIGSSGGMKTQMDSIDSNKVDRGYPLSTRLLFTLNREPSQGKEGKITGHLASYNNNGYVESNYSFTHEVLDSYVSSQVYLLDNKPITFGQKKYVSIYVENSDNSIRTVDPSQLTNPNTEYEHVYLFYVIVED